LEVVVCEQLVFYLLTIVLFCINFAAYIDTVIARLSFHVCYVIGLMKHERIC